ncbi:glycogen synthase [bacterium]|nr:glycogen synthase [bacterium]MBU1063605.1 glycogen synthase [bacterium]MBU1635703.1 glycogen synthase [bacterium]MBU1874530.1 glycogen synthase [bacterium]
MRIAFVSAEVYPFSKVGGLGDVAGALPLELAELGVEIMVITPRYGSIDHSDFGIQDSPYRFTVKLGNEAIDCGLSRWQSPQHPNVRVYFIENERYFGSRGVYTDRKGTPCDDNAQRFLLLSKAALEICKVMNWIPDIIHCNDNHCALISVYLKNKPSEYPLFQNTKTLLTLHNIAYQGTVSMDRRGIYDLPDNLFYPTVPMEWYGRINPLKAGILFADAINTVSPTHAREIAEDEQFSAGLKGVIAATGKPVHGILNGVDYSKWSPQRDIYIAKPYSVRTVSEKKFNKIALLNDTGIDPAMVDKPLIGMVTRLVEQKGIPLLIEGLERMLALDLAIIILGSGEPDYERSLSAFAERFPGRLKIDFGYNNPLSHKIMAGCDMFLMPSRFEPCGITQMAALKYGTAPVVHQTGGLADTVIQWNGQTGNGFVFEEYAVDDLIKSVRSAISVYYDKYKWRQIMLNGMATDFSWQQSAKQYIELYHSLL